MTANSCKWHAAGSEWIPECWCYSTKTPARPDDHGNCPSCGKPAYLQRHGGFVPAGWKCTCCYPLPIGYFLAYMVAGDVLTVHHNLRRAGAGEPPADVYECGQDEYSRDDILAWREIPGPREIVPRHKPPVP